MQHLMNQNSKESDLEVDKMEVRSWDKLCLKVFVLVTCIKVLLIPTYHSTDFEVHRNWLAITNSLPLNQWYTSEKSQWTLDYPPFFAWFEYALSKVAAVVDPQMVEMEESDYASQNAKLFQRATVIFADLIFAYGVREAGKTFCTSYQSFRTSALLALCNIGLLVVDHVHFQYNGFLLGVLLLSVAKTCKNEVMQGAALFAILLNLKHIYLYVAPAFGVWLLRSYCLGDNKFFIRFTKLGSSVILIFLVSFGPFADEIPQILSRLFPFKRGLLHAYWAPNAWALYAALDKILSLAWKRVGWLRSVKVASMTGGLVQEDSFSVLATPTPLMTFAITLLTMTPALYTLFFDTKASKRPRKFLKCVILCGLTSFMFGWHVHEKAILTAIIPLCILASMDPFDARVFLILSSSGHASLFPLLYPDELTPLKIFLWFTYFLGEVMLFKKQFACISISVYEQLYISFLPLITVYETMLHKLIFSEKLPFLPLVLTSVYCSLGITYSYIIYYHDYLFKSGKSK